MSNKVIKKIWIIIIASGLVISIAWVAYMLFDLYVNYHGNECLGPALECITVGSIFQVALSIMFFTAILAAAASIIFELMYLLHAKLNKIKDYHFNWSNFSISILIIILLYFLQLAYWSYKDYHQCNRSGVNQCNIVP